MNWLYFILIGWWLGIIWFGIGLLLCLTVIGIPAGFPMILKTPEMTFGES